MPRKPKTKQANADIRIRGARVHNLRGVDVDIPRDAMTVITGVSGSGKSSLAFDTLFAEGQRQYIDSLSAYARQFLDQIPRPDVESIEGLAPTLAIDQKPGSTGARSTVATSHAKSTTICVCCTPASGSRTAACAVSSISQQSAESIRDCAGCAWPAGTKLVLMLADGSRSPRGPSRSLGIDPRGRLAARPRRRRNLSCWMKFRRWHRERITRSRPSSIDWSFAMGSIRG